MEKARLVLVRENRALATPLELGSHESVTPVSTATKSADGESAFQSAESVLSPELSARLPTHTRTFFRRGTVSVIYDTTLLAFSAGRD